MNKSKFILPVAVIMGVLTDRLIIAPVLSDSYLTSVYGGAFWLCWLAAVYALYWERLRKNPYAWFLAACSFMLCLWPFFFRGGNGPYGALAYIAVPCVLMCHAQLAAGACVPDKIEGVVIAWFAGWLIKPFSGLPAFGGALGALFKLKERPMAKRVLLGVFCSLLLLIVLIPLLIGADMVFSYYISRIFAGVSVSSSIGHAAAVVAMSALFYSFIWNIAQGANEPFAFPQEKRFDTIACGIVLCAVSVLYIIFCAVMSTYLFAGAGLPEGLTYAEYARAGFAQTLAVCAINLMIFAACARFGDRGAFMRAMLGLLLALTAVMLVSGAVRLGLYVGVYGLTWLRLLSAWFIIYLAAVILLCAAWLFKEKIPLLIVCAAAFLVWYAALGYADPDALIARYNYAGGFEVTGY